MNGDWIKIEHVMPDKPEIVKMASLLGIEQDLVVGKIIRLWIWADQQEETCEDMPITYEFIDRITFCNGFANALADVGWLYGFDGFISFPNFDSHNGKSTKKKAVTSKRVSFHRDKCNAVSVTNVTLTALQEQDTDEKEEGKPINSLVAIRPIEQIPKTYIDVLTLMSGQPGRPMDKTDLRRCAESFFDDFSARGWKDARGIPLCDWKPAARKYARTWAINSAKGTSFYASRCVRKDANDGRSYA